MPLSHRFAISILHVVVGGKQVSLKHCVWIDATCTSALVQLLMVLHILEGLVTHLWRTIHVLAVPSKLVTSVDRVTLVSCHEVTRVATLIIVLVVDVRRRLIIMFGISSCCIHVGFASLGWALHVLAALSRLSDHWGIRILLMASLLVHLISWYPVVLIIHLLFLLFDLLELKVMATRAVVAIALLSIALQDALDCTVPVSIRSFVSIPTCRLLVVVFTVSVRAFFVLLTLLA